MSENALKRLKSYAEDIFRDKKRLIRILLIVFILLLALMLRLYENSKSDITVDSSMDVKAEGEICVDIGGAVVTSIQSAPEQDCMKSSILQEALSVMPTRIPLTAPNMLRTVRR